MDGFKLVIDTDGIRHLVDSGGVRQATEVEPGIWELAIRATNWSGLMVSAKNIDATPDPGRVIR